MALRFIIFGGERLNFQMLKQWQQHFGLMSPLLVNMYGITETTVHSSWHIISNDDLEHTESIIGELLPDSITSFGPLMKVICVQAMANCFSVVRKSRRVI